MTNDYMRHKNNRKKTASYHLCPICNKPVRDQSTALIHSTTKLPAHFDCILIEIKKKEELKANEKICYLGKGCFGILSFRNSSSPLRFLIRKRIQYENSD